MNKKLNRLIIHLSALVCCSASPTFAKAESCAQLSATQYVEQIGYCASSVLRSRRGLSYGPKNLFDDSDQTAWCEGVKGTGIGQTLNLQIKGGSPFRRLIFSNGYAKSSSTYERNARVRSLKVETDRGDSFTADIADTGKPSYIDLPTPASYQNIKLTIRAVYPGNRYKDTCINFVMPDFEFEEELAYKAKQASEAENQPVASGQSIPGIRVEPANQPPAGSTEKIPDLPKQ